MSGLNVDPYDLALPGRAFEEGGARSARDDITEVSKMSQAASFPGEKIERDGSASGITLPPNL